MQRPLGHDEEHGEQEREAHHAPDGRRRRIDAPSGGVGSVDLVVLHEVGAHLEVGGQVEHQVLEGRVLQELGLGQRRLAAGTVLAALEAAVQLQHHVAEHVAEEQEAQEVVAEELEVRRICAQKGPPVLGFSGYGHIPETIPKMQSRCLQRICNAVCTFIAEISTPSLNRYFKCF